MLKKLEERVETMCFGTAFFAVVFAGMVIDSSIPVAVVSLGIAVIMAGILAIREM